MGGGNPYQSVADRVARYVGRTLSRENSILLAELISGASVTEIAGRREMTQSGARNRIQRCLSTVGVSKRAELSALVADAYSSCGASGQSPSRLPIPGLPAEVDEDASKPTANSRT